MIYPTALAALRGRARHDSRQPAVMSEFRLYNTLTRTTEPLPPRTESLC